MRTKKLDLIDPQATLAKILKRCDGEGDSECWTWTGATDKTSGGYGQVAVQTRSATSKHGYTAAKPHRVVWTIMRGDIADSMVIDHAVCANRRCCNPAHMEVVTQAENARRANAKRPAPDHCAKCGSSEWISLRGNRRCRSCWNAYFKQWQRDNKPDISCPECGVKFQRTAENMRFCSQPCRRESTLRRRRDWARAKAARLREASQSP